MQRWTLSQLQQQLLSKNAQTRRQAAEALGQLKDGRAVEALLMALTGGERDLLVKHAAAEALEEIADPQAVPGLGEGLPNTQEECVRAFRWGMLGEIVR